MSHKVKDFYDAYKDHSAELYSEIRRETYGEDIGQNSWLTVDEYRHFLSLLKLKPHRHLLEVASGSGGPAVFAAKETGCRITGIDINQNGVTNAQKLAKERGLSDLVNFLVVDASGALPFADESFDAIISIDSINHLKSREQIFREFRRVLKREGVLLFTDAVVVTGILTNEEIAVRSSLGFFLFVPQGENERLLNAAGFIDVKVEDVTENIVTTAKKWLEAREKRKSRLLEFEDEEKFNGIQQFLSTTHLVSSERRLSRFMYCCVKGS